LPSVQTQVEAEARLARQVCQRGRAASPPFQELAPAHADSPSQPEPREAARRVPPCGVGRNDRAREKRMFDGERGGK
jgi:hypothetical protein